MVITTLLWWLDLETICTGVPFSKPQLSTSSLPCWVGRLIWGPSEPMASDPRLSSHFTVDGFYHPLISQFLKDVLNTYSPVFDFVHIYLNLVLSKAIRSPFQQPTTFTSYEDGVSGDSHFHKEGFRT